MALNKADTATPEPRPLGRKRDHSRDAIILEATLEVLAEVGATGLTMDLVAARAGAGKATIYRRWASKTELFIDAIAHLKNIQVDLEALPDTGTLRGDLLALFKPIPIEETERRLKIMAAIASLISQDPALTESANAAVIQPWSDAHFALMQRAAKRGEIAADADIETLSQILPSLNAYRVLVLHKPFDLDFLLLIVDAVLMPALRR